MEQAGQAGQAGQADGRKLPAFRALMGTRKTSPHSSAREGVEGGSGLICFDSDLGMYIYSWLVLTYLTI
jgi:hypothetical protein